MSTTYTGLAAGSLTIQKYNNFRGVDFSDSHTAETRSPDALNMWKNYRTLGKQVETRPDIVLKKQLSGTIYGLFFYSINSITHWIIHSGVTLYDYNPNTDTLTTLKATGMNPKKSNGFIYNNILFILDGINYLEYNGSTLSDVVGTIPITSIGRTPDGAGTQYQYINLLSSSRKNGFYSDGESTVYYLDAQNIDSVDAVYINDVLQTTGYTVDLTEGTVTFTTAPAKSVDQDNVMIQYTKAVSDYPNMLKHCTIAQVFDNRIFFAGNQNYPNTLRWCAYNDARYIPDMNYSIEGNDVSQIKALVPGNNALWVFKEPSQANTTVFYHTPSLEYNSQLEDNVKVYPGSHSSISTGCIATGINFNDDIVFFSDRGMEGIAGDVTTEQVLAHRSTLVDRKLLNETNYESMVLDEWEGYLLVFTGNKVYLADSNNMVTNNNHNEYEWFYWELSKSVSYSKVDEGILYIGTTDGGIYTLTDTGSTRSVTSYWTTTQDDFNYPQMLKTTNKRGFKVGCSGSDITIASKTDNNSFETLGTYTNTKGYIVAKLKRKKWNTIQLKFSGTKPFGIYDIALESYIGSYVKRS